MILITYACVTCPSLQLPCVTHDFVFYRHVYMFFQRALLEAFKISLQKIIEWFLIGPITIQIEGNIVKIIRINYLTFVSQST